jgi:hypothetical protein
MDPNNGPAGSFINDLNRGKEPYLATMFAKLPMSVLLGRDDRDMGADSFVLSR